MALAFASDWLLHLRVSKRERKRSDERVVGCGSRRPSARTLTSLRLRSNSIGDEGARSLGAALGTIATLASLNLGCNNICDKGERALASALDPPKNARCSTRGGIRERATADIQNLVTDLLNVNKIVVKVASSVAYAAAKVAEVQLAWPATRLR